MLFVNDRTRQARLETCNTCEHFVGLTKSCGPLITEAFTDSKLCGCHMPTKTRLKTASCPLDKWPAEITKDDLDAIRHMLENKRDYTTQDLVDWHNKVTGRNRNRTSCTPCNNNMIKDLRKLLKESEK